MSNVIKFPTTLTHSTQTHEDRILRIRASLEKINQLMSELQKFNNEYEAQHDDKR